MTKEPEPDPQIKIEPLDSAKHDRAAFSCGTAQIDNFLKYTANKHQKGDFTKVWVAISAEEKGHVLGFYAINTHSILTEDLPEQIRKKAPKHDEVGAAYVSMMGVRQANQGKGIGTALLVNALKRIASIAYEIGVFAAVLDVLEDENTDRRKAFYESLGFISFPSQPLRMFLPVTTIRQCF